MRLPSGHIRAAVRLATCASVLLLHSSSAFSDAGDRPAMPLFSEPVPRCLLDVQDEAGRMGISLQVVQASTPGGTVVDSADAWWHEHPTDILVWIDGPEGHLISRWQSYRRARRTIQQATRADHWPCSLENPLRELLGSQRQHRLILLAIAAAGAAVWIPALWMMARFRRGRNGQNST
jgi:hypothetical protein